MSSDETGRHNPQNTGDTSGNYTQFNYGGQLVTPNSIPVLVLGILSIVFCWCYGVLSIILGIIALVLASQGEKSYRLNPNSYSVSSYKNLKAGKACAIIGLCLAGVTILLVVVYIIVFGTIALSMLNLGLTS